MLFFFICWAEIQGKCVRAPSSVRVWIFLWSITVLNLSRCCSESPRDCLHFHFKRASLKAARRGEAVTQPRHSCVPLSPGIRPSKAAWSLALVPGKLLLYKPPRSTEGISEVVLIPADDNAL